MPMMILKNVHNRLTFGFRRRTGIRSTCDTDQLRAQLKALKFSVAEYKSQLDGLSRELAEARLEIARVGMSIFKNERNRLAFGARIA